MLVCGASFAGLATARELSGSGARVLLIDRYEIGEKQTSACAAPTEWLENLGLTGAIRQTFDDLVIHRARAFGGRDTTKTYRWHLPWSFSTFDYREICDLLKAQSPDVPFETAKVEGRTGETVHTDRGDLTAPLIVDSLGWPRYLSESGQRVTPPNARVSRGLEVHPRAPTRTSSCGSTRSTSRRATPGTSRPATSCGSASARSTRTSTSSARPSSSRRSSRSPPTAGRATGSRTRCAPRPTGSCSSPGTAPATASRSPPRASVPRCTSAWRPGASSARSSRAARPARRRSTATRPSATSTCGRSAGCCARSTSSAGRTATRSSTPCWTSWTATASSTGRSTTTSTSRRPPTRWRARTATASSRRSAAPRPHRRSSPPRSRRSRPGVPPVPRA
ncbi:hypothetical protein GKE82_00705 [Conexibacter sp. W3-3-2]|nr:hypothetical protein [Conexibacter sp. W3-3-2]